MKPKEWPVPGFFDQSKADRVWKVSYEERARQAEDWARLHGIAPALADSFRVCLMCIDVQNTFCLPEYELFVAGRSGRGAVEDSIRLCRFIYRNLGRITEIDPTMDTHTAIQIFHQVFWIDEKGEHPAPYTNLSLDEILRGVWRVNPAVPRDVGGRELSLEAHALHYARRLTEGGKYPLIIWPYHSMLGGVGHALVSSVEEAVFFHSIARCSRPDFQVKGRNSLTENYSVLGPEVADSYDGKLVAQKNQQFLDKLLAFDAVIIAGQAKSHCVAWTIDDLLREILPQDPKLVRKVYLLEDCTSPVVAPGNDFTDHADAAFQRFADAGMHVVRSVEPIETWPEMTR